MTELRNLIDQRVKMFQKIYLNPNIGDSIHSAAYMINEAIKRGGNILVAGNGGSAALADHFVAELVGRYKSDRRPLPAVSFSENSTGTAIANDFEFRQVFSRQLEAFSTNGNNLLVLFTTSGQSKNIIAAIDSAKIFGIMTVVICGKNTELIRHADMLVQVEETDTALIQEAHQTFVHLLCGLVDDFWSELPGSIMGIDYGRQ